MPDSRPLALAVLVGVLHAAALLAVALHLGYDVGPSSYSALGAGWRYGGLVLLGAVPVWLAAEYRLVTPLLALLATTGYVVGAELSPPGPTFRDVAELEHLDEPTGITVVENGLYAVRYMANASVWLVGFLFAGLVEGVVRRVVDPLPSPAGLDWLAVPMSRNRAASVAAVGGLLHVAAMTWFALRLGVSASGATAWLVYGFGIAGMWILAAVPLYALVRLRLVAPAALLTAFVLVDVRSDFSASVEDAHALYFGGWFLWFAVLLAAMAAEYGLRRAVSTVRAA